MHRPCGPGCEACVELADGVASCDAGCDPVEQTGCDPDAACLAWRLGSSGAGTALVGVCGPRPGGEGRPGDACLPRDGSYHGDCAPTSTCAVAVRAPALDRRCMPLCDDAHPCPGASACERVEDAALPLGQTATCRGDCRVEAENPCEDGQFCRPAAVGVAADDAALVLVGWCTAEAGAAWGAAGDPCEGAPLPSTCGAGLACAAGRCAPLCALDGHLPCAAGAACAPLPGLPAYGTCDPG
ncbi:MAG: hypothetical protein R3F43_11760 [bacterium]